MIDILTIVQLLTRKSFRHIVYAYLRFISLPDVTYPAPILHYLKGKGKVFQLQARCGPEGG